MGTTRVFRVETVTEWEETQRPIEFVDVSLTIGRREEHTFFIQAFNHFDAESKSVELLRGMYPEAYASGKFTATAFLDNPRDLEREEQTDEEKYAHSYETVEGYVEGYEVFYLARGHSFHGGLNGQRFALVDRLGDYPSDSVNPPVVIRAWNNRIEFCDPLEG